MAAGLSASLITPLPERFTWSVMISAQNQRAAARSSAQIKHVPVTVGVKIKSPRERQRTRPGKRRLGCIGMILKNGEVLAFPAFRANLLYRRRYPSKFHWLCIARTTHCRKAWMPFPGPLGGDEPSQVRSVAFTLFTPLLEHPEHPEIFSDPV